MSSSSYRAAVERLSAQLDQLHSHFIASATLPVHRNRSPSRSPAHSPAPRFPATHTLHSSQPNPALFLASMGFHSEGDDVEALDRYLEAISDRRFTRSAAPPAAESALSHQHQSPSQQRASQISHSNSSSSAAPSAAHARTPKRPRSAPLSVSRSSRVEESTPLLTSSASVKKARDKRADKPADKHKLPSHTSAPSTSIKLKLRVRAPDEHELLDAHQPSQTSHRSKQRKREARDTRQSSRRFHHQLEHVETALSDGSKPSRKPRESSKRKRRSKSSRDDLHDEDHHSTHEQLTSTQEPSHDSTPQSYIAKRKTKLRKEKPRKRRAASASNDSIEQSSDDSEKSNHYRSDHTGQKVRRPAARKRRKVSTVVESETEEPISEGLNVPAAQSPGGSSPDMKDRTIEEDDEEKFAAAPKPQPIQATEVKNSPDPAASLLAFARKSVSLSSVEGMDKDDVIKHRQSLATIPGCEPFKELSLFGYCKALCHHHKQALESQKMSYDGRILKGKEFDALSWDIDDDCWRKWLAGDHHASDTCPPGLSEMFDAIRFLRRLLERISDSDDDIAAPFMERCYGEGLTIDVADLTLGIIRFWYHAKRDKAESEENYSELVDWAIRLAISIVIYELSPLSFISSVKNLRAQSLFISRLHSSEPDEHSVSFEKLLSFAMEFLQGCPNGLGKECRNSVSELMQVFMLRRSVPWENNSPQQEHWERINEQSQKLPQVLCQHEFFWSNSFSKALQQVRREPLAGDSFFDVGFLVSIVSSPLFLRELLQNQSKCLALLCDVMTKSLEVISREPLMAFRTVLNEAKHFSSVPTVLDLIQTLVSSAVMQRELLATDVKIKDLFLNSVNMLLIRSARMGSAVLFQDKLETLAEKSFLSSKEMDFIVDEPLTSSGIDDEKVMIRQRVLAFNAILLASMGKSLEDGSRDMSQMNALKAFLRSKAASTRNRMRTWEVVLRIQGGLDDHYIDDGVKKSVLSPDDRNHFTMAVEAIRKHFLRCSDDDSKTPSADEKSSSSMEDLLPRKRGSAISFPSVTSISLLCRTASQHQGHVDLDDDPHFLRLLQNVTKEEAQQTLARFDPESEFAWKWVRLQRKNAYIDGARDLLEKTDRTLGQICTCLPGNAKEKPDGSENRVACSNELCENRHLRIECVPGECGAGSYCQNQRLQRLEYAKFKMVNFPNKGVGLVADEDIRTGDLIGEYQGEVISMETFRERMREYQGERHFYFMTLTNKLVIDASRKSQATRFLNHSCDPNAETQKWNAGGEPRVGIYAVRDIAKGEELTFDYGARSIEKGSAPCVCQSSKCRGTLTSKQEDHKSSAKSTKLDAVNAKPTDPQGRYVASVEQDEPDVERIVRAKIERAKKDLERASKLGLLAEEKGGDSKAFDEIRLSPGASERLRAWREAMNKLNPSKSSTSRVRDEVDSTFRIPRRSISVAPNVSDGERITSARDSLKRRPGSHSESGREIEAKTMTAGSSSFPMPRVPRRSSVIADLRPRVPLSKLPGNSSATQKVSRSSLDRKLDSERPLSRVALIGREQGFQPSSTRHKRKPLKPKVKQRMKTRKTGSDNDSMGEYSTASEAEPIMDEEPFSPSQLPDGQGARSDDEFVADSPLEPLRIHREERKVSDKHQNVYPKQDGAIQQGREEREPSAHQQPITTKNSNAGQTHSLERSSRLPHRLSEDLERDQYAGRKVDHARHSNGPNDIRSSGHAPMGSQEPYADREWVGTREAHDNRHRSIGREVRDSRMSQRVSLKGRPPRESDYNDRNPHFSHEPFRRTSPRLSRERGAMRDFGRNRLERPRFSEGALNEPFRRHERYVPRDRGYVQGYSETQHRYRERQRWVDAIREEPIRSRDAGGMPKDFVQPRPSNDVPPLHRDHPPRDVPPRTLPPRDRPGRDHPVRDQPVRDHPPRDHPSRSHALREHPSRDHLPREHQLRDRPSRDHPFPSKQRQTGSRFAETEKISDERHPGQNLGKPQPSVDGGNVQRKSDKAHSVEDKPAQGVFVAELHQSADRERRERSSSHSQLHGNGETPARPSADVLPKDNAAEAPEARTSAAAKTRLDSKYESKDVLEPESIRKDGGVATRKGMESPKRARQVSAPRVSAPQEGTQTGLESSKWSRFQQSSEGVGANVVPKQDDHQGTESSGVGVSRTSKSHLVYKGSEVKTGETKAENTASKERNEGYGIVKRSVGREEIRRSRFQADDVRSIGNKRVSRDGESNEKLGLNQVKRRKREGDVRTPRGTIGKTGGQAMGWGSHGAREGYGKQVSRYGESRVINEHDGRDRWKSYDGNDGYDESGFRRRSSDGHREDRKRSRLHSPIRGTKKKKKLGREGPRPGNAGDKGRQEGRRSQGSTQVVRGSSTRQDLRSLLRKGRATE